MEELLPLRGRRVLELGCGAAWTTRLLVGRLGAASVSAYEVDLLRKPAANARPVPARPPAAQ